MVFPTYTEIRRWPGGFAKGLYDKLKDLSDRMDIVEGGEVEDKLKTVTVNVSATNSTGSSAADPTLIEGIPIGIVPAGNQDQLVDNVEVESDGKVKVTLAAAATAQNNFNVTVQKYTEPGPD